MSTISLPRALLRRNRINTETTDLPFWISVSVVALYALAAIIGPLITHYDPIATNIGQSFVTPFGHSGHSGFQLLGTDQLGRDLFDEIISGARTSLLIGVVTIAVSVVAGAAIGIVAGVKGGVIDGLLMRIADVQLAFPSIVMALLIVGALGPSVLNVIVSLSLASWVVFARIARAEAVRVRGLPYVDASRLLGAKTFHIMRSAVLPACIRPLSVYMTVQFAFVVVAEASLSFLGVGVPADVPSWGSTIAGGENYLSSAWWITTFPGIVLAILVTALSILGARLGRREG